MKCTVLLPVFLFLGETSHAAAPLEGFVLRGKNAAEGALRSSTHSAPAAEEASHRSAASAATKSTQIAQQVARVAKPTPIRAEPNLYAIPTSPGRSRSPEPEPFLSFSQYASVENLRPEPEGYVKFGGGDPTAFSMVR